MNRAQGLNTLLNLEINSPEKLRELFEEWNRKLSSEEITSFTLELIQKKDLFRKFRKDLIAGLCKILTDKLELKKALQVYKTLVKVEPSEENLQTYKKLIHHQDLERFKLIKPKIPLDFEGLVKLRSEGEEKNVSIEALFIEKFKVPKADLLKSIEDYYKIIALDLKKLLLQQQLKRLPDVIAIKAQFFKDLLSIPFEYLNEIYIFTYYPEDVERIEKVKKLLHFEEVKVAFSIKEDIESAIDAYYQETLLDGLIEEVEETEEEAQEELDSAAVTLVNQIIEEAYRRRASDIHWEGLSGKRGLSVRFRVDGECFHYMTIPESQKRACISRIKIMANLDIAEKRLPQDGKIKFKTKDGKIFELRVATLPTIENNEDVVMRILGGIEFRALEEISLLPVNYEKIKHILNLPYGLILCVGPTGSGKTTTLHAFLKYLNQPSKKIWTAEDPVEIVQDGLRQVQVNPKIGLTFSRVLRAFLRADPDIIMIGETRDQETAHILIEAALTGHLVLSTLHTNSAPETITRLLGMGIDPFNFADSLLGVIAQRLAKRLCQACKAPYSPSKEEIQRIKQEYGTHQQHPLDENLLREAQFYQPGGCEKCNFTGFKGRLGIHELLIPDDELKDLIIRNASANEIRMVALKKGMLTLKQDGILKVLKGETTLKQILAVTLK